MRALVRTQIRRATFRFRIRLAGSWAPYRRLASALRWWPLGLPRLHRRARPPSDPHVAYVLWRYPVLVETMIQRELEGLRRAGLRITVVADEPEPGVAPLSELAARDVVYLAGRMRFPLRRFLLRRPLRTAHLFLYVLSRRYGPTKSFAVDRRTFRSAAEVAATACELGVDHLHAPWAGHHAFVTLVASRLAGVSYSVHARAYDLHQPGAVWAVGDKLRHAAFAVTNSRFNQEHIRRLVGRRAPHVQRIYNGVDPERLRPDRSRAPRDGAPRLLSVARLIPEKGFEVLLPACAALRDRGVPFACDVVGAAPETHGAHRLVLRRLHARLALGDVVRFLGARSFPEVEDAYRAADVFVLACTPTTEGRHDITPNVILEAMAMGLPVVSTRVGGLPELVDHEVNGLLVEPGDSVALAEALERLLRDAGLRRELGHAAREKVLARFDIRANAEAYAALFRGVAPPVGDHRGPLVAEGLLQE